MIAFHAFNHMVTFLKSAYFMPPEIGEVPIVIKAASTLKIIFLFVYLVC